VGLQSPEAPTLSCSSLEKYTGFEPVSSFFIFLFHHKYLLIKIICQKD
jgi:hypothetical protein